MKAISLKSKLKLPIGILNNHFFNVNNVHQVQNNELLGHINYYLLANKLDEDENDDEVEFDDEFDGEGEFDDEEFDGEFDGEFDDEFDDEKFEDED
jgi:hypothetical protein